MPASEMTGPALPYYLNSAGSPGSDRAAAMGNPIPGVLVIFVQMSASNPLSSIHIREAQPADAQALSELILDNAGALLRSHYSDEQWDVFVRYYAVPVMAEKISSQAVFCVERGGEIVGTVALDGDFVVGFYTRLGYMGQGIGKMLMAHLEEYARGKGIATIQLAASPIGVAFYLKNGWHTVKELTLEYLGVGFEETLMSKML